MRHPLAVSLAAVVALVACGDDSGGLVTTVAPPVTTVTPPTSAAPTSPPSTIPITTTEPATTPPAPPSTTTPSPTVPSGTWVPLDDVPVWAVPPCCASPWPVDQPSPPLPAPGQPLADGLYEFSVAESGWASFRPDRLRVTVRRFDRCGDWARGDIFCESDDPDEIGVVQAQATEFTLALDASVDVRVLGFSCAAYFTPLWASDGVGLARLLTDLDADVESQIRTPIWAGESPDDVVAALTGRFSPNPCEADRGPGAYWDSGVGPTLLFQSVVTDMTVPVGSDRLLFGVVLQITGGRPVLWMQRTWMP